MADKEIKVHRRVIRMIFTIIQRAKNDRSVRRALPVYDNDVIAIVHYTDDDISFYDGLGMLIRKTATLCINSTWIALFINGFMPVKHGS